MRGNTGGLIAKWMLCEMLGAVSADVRYEDAAAEKSGLNASRPMARPLFSCSHDAGPCRVARSGKVL